jgi:hypothetical protein
LVQKRIISAVKRVEFVNDRMSYIILRGHWFDSVLNVYAPTEDITDNVKDTLYEALERVFNKFPKHHTKILLGDFSAKLGRENIFRPTVGNEILHKSSNDNGVKNLIGKTTMFPHSKIHKYTCTSPDGKPHNQIAHILMGRRRHLNITCCSIIQSSRL